MALEDLSITFDDAKKVFGICMAIGTFMASGVVWMGKLESRIDGHITIFEPIVTDTAKITVAHAKEMAVLRVEINNLKSDDVSRLANARLEW